MLGHHRPVGHNTMKQGHTKQEGLRNAFEGGLQTFSRSGGPELGKVEKTQLERVGTPQGHEVPTE